MNKTTNHVGSVTQPVSPEQEKYFGNGALNETIKSPNIDAMNEHAAGFDLKTGDSTLHSPRKTNREVRNIKRKVNSSLAHSPRHNMAIIYRGGAP